MIDPNLLHNNLAEVAEKKVKRNFMLDTEKTHRVRRSAQKLTSHYRKLRNVMLVPKPLVLLKCVVKISHHYWQMDDMGNQLTEKHN